MKKDDCIFCKIAAGDIPSATVYEDEDFRAVMDIAPAAKGHVILLPKDHAADIYELPDEIAAKALPVAKKIAKAVKEATGCEGVNILQNNGMAAGQTVFHVHFHIIPRRKGDGVSVTWKQGEYADGEAAKFAEDIASKIGKS